MQATQSPYYLKALEIVKVLGEGWSVPDPLYDHSARIAHVDGYEVFIRSEWNKKDRFSFSPRHEFDGHMEWEDRQAKESGSILSGFTFSRDRDPKIMAKKIKASQTEAQPAIDRARDVKAKRDAESASAEAFNAQIRKILGKPEMPEDPRYPESFMKYWRPIASAPNLYNVELSSTYQNAEIKISLQDPEKLKALIDLLST